MNEKLMKASKLSIPGNTLRVLIYMLAFDNNGEIRIKQEDIANALGISRPNTVTAITELRAKGILEVTKQGRRNVYKVK